MKQTAVEFMVEELDKSIGLTKFVDTCDEDYKQEILGIIDQSKAMEREQREKDLESGFYAGRTYQGREGGATLEQLKERNL